MHVTRAAVVAASVVTVAMVAHQAPRPRPTRALPLSPQSRRSARRCRTTIACSRGLPRRSQAPYGPAAHAQDRRARSVPSLTPPT